MIACATVSIFQACLPQLIIMGIGSVWNENQLNLLLPLFGEMVCSAPQKISQQQKWIILGNRAPGQHTGAAKVTCLCTFVFPIMPCNWLYNYANIKMAYQRIRAKEQLIYHEAYMYACPI